MTAGEPGTDPRLNSEVPHGARIWNYWLGGKDNFAADRAVGDQVRDVYPDVVKVARASRAFLARAVTYLVEEAGIRQFLDLGTGLPTADNTHEVAQALAPESRIVYVDNDPLVLVHARALLTSSAEGATAYVDADVRDVGGIIEAAGETLDFTRPVAVMMLGILGNVPDEDDPRGLVERFMAAVPSGSYVTINDSVVTTETLDAKRVANDSGADYHLRTPAQLKSFLAGFELVDPGVVSTPLWRPEPGPDGTPPAALNVMCGMARKP